MEPNRLVSTKIHRTLSMKFREYYRLKTHNEKWVREIIEKYSLSENYPRVAEYVIKREVYLEWVNGAYL